MTPVEKFPLEPLLIYRVEHENDGAGPYAFRDGTRLQRKVGNYLRDKHDDCPLHPIPPLGMAVHHQDCVYGFMCIEAFYCWFDEKDREMLQGAGYVLRTYETYVVEWEDDSGQCLFYKPEKHMDQYSVLTPVEEWN